MIRILAYLIIMLAIMGIVGTYDFEEAERQEQEYCEMVKLYKQTRGREGWPEYRKGEVFCGQK